MKRITVRWLRVCTCYTASPEIVQQMRASDSRQPSSEYIFLRSLFCLFCKFFCFYFYPTIVATAIEIKFIVLLSSYYYLIIIVVLRHLLYFGPHSLIIAR